MDRDFLTHSSCNDQDMSCALCVLTREIVVVLLRRVEL
jgi:hypothetical protein